MRSGASVPDFCGAQLLGYRGSTDGGSDRWHRQGSFGTVRHRRRSSGSAETDHERLPDFTRYRRNTLSLSIPNSETHSDISDRALKMMSSTNEEDPFLQVQQYVLPDLPD